MPSSTLEAALDALFAAPLDQFMAKRAELAGVHSSLAKIRKPPLSAWAVNQAVRAEGKLTKELLDAGAGLRKAQAALLKGGDPDAFRAAQARLHAAVKALRDTAVQLAIGAGHSASAGLSSRLEKTLFAGATGQDDGRKLLEQGRLTADLEVADVLEHGGFGRGENHEQDVASARELKEASTAARELEKAADEVERVAEKAAAAAQAAQARADAATEQARLARQTASQAHERAAEARERATQAAQHLAALQLKKA